MRFFVSDTHFFHQRILEYCPTRPWKTVIEMNEGLIEAWNSVVKPDDEVFHLGDFSLAFRPVEVYTRRLNGMKHLIVGNHDFASPCHKKSKTPEKQAEWIVKYIDNGWTSVKEQDNIWIGNTYFNMAHLPYIETNSFEDQRHLKYRLPDEGIPLLCGHIHQHWLTRRTGKGTLMINVGVDKNPWQRPWSEDELCEIIEKENK